MSAHLQGNSDAHGMPCGPVVRALVEDLVRRHPGGTARPESDVLIVGSMPVSRPNGQVAIQIHPYLIFFPDAKHLIGAVLKVVGDGLNNRFAAKRADILNHIVEVWWPRARRTTYQGE